MAVTLAADALALRLNEPLDRAHQLLAVASALVERYAKEAPSAVQDEAAYRLAGWLARTPSSDLYVTGFAAISMEMRTTPARTALRNSGAMGLLSMFHRPRANIIGEGEEDAAQEDAPMQIALTLTGADILDLATARRVLVPATSATSAIRPESLTVWKSGSVGLVADYGAHLVIALADATGGPLALSGDWQHMWQGRFGYLPDVPDLARSGSWRADYELPDVGERQEGDAGRYFSRGTPLLVGAWRLGPAGVRDVTPTDWEAALTFSPDYRLTLAVSYEVLP